MLFGFSIVKATQLVNLRAKTILHKHKHPGPQTKSDISKPEEATIMKEAKSLSTRKPAQAIDARKANSKAVPRGVVFLLVMLLLSAPCIDGFGSLQNFAGRTSQNIKVCNGRLASKGKKKRGNQMLGKFLDFDTSELEEGYNVTMLRKDVREAKNRTLLHPEEAKFLRKAINVVGIGLKLDLENKESESQDRFKTALETEKVSDAELSLLEEESLEKKILETESLEKRIKKVLDNVPKNRADSDVDVGGVSDKEAVAGANKTITDFFKLVVKYAKEKWETESDWKNVELLLVYQKEGPEKKKKLRLDGLEISRDEMEEIGTAAIDEIEKIENVTYQILEVRAYSKSFAFNKVFWANENKFSKVELDAAFGKLSGDLKELKKFAEYNLLPIENTDEKQNIINPDLSFVTRKTTEQNDDDPFDTLDKNTQLDKSFAIVVTGESGSGKSVLSCLEAEERGYLPMYLLLRGKPSYTIYDKSSEGKEADNSDKKIATVPDIFNKKPTTPEFENLHSFLKGLLNCYDKGSDQWKALLDIKSALYETRNNLALKMLKTAMNDFARSSVNAKMWIDDCWSTAAKPEKVAVIVDEATDIDLVEGLITKIRPLTKKYSYLAKKRVIFILTGTGLDLIRSGDRIGSNPDYSKLVVVDSPNLEELERKGKIDHVVLKAMNDGLFSKVMKTNSRMLFRSTIPILKDNFHKTDGNYGKKEREQRLVDRLTNIASCQDVMDHGPRFYVNQKSMTRKSLEVLLKDAFMYHLTEAIGAIRTSKENAKIVAKEFKSANKIRTKLEKDFQSKVTDRGSMNIFTQGLVSRSGTSNALKYLACFGLTCKVRSAFSNQFEELTALHCLRLMQIEGYNTKRITLKHMWPPKSDKSKITNDDIKSLKKTLEMQAKTEVSFDIESGKVGIVFSQGTPSVQGGDVLLLRIDGGESAEIEWIQCKHRTKVNVNACWWSSLGVAFADDNGKILTKTDMAPKTGKAGYSYAGLDAFREFVKGRLVASGRKDAKVKLGKRTLAVSFNAPETADIPKPKSAETRVWFREMFEPTISTFDLKPAIDDETTPVSGENTRKRNSGNVE